ncbi:MAG: response regulator [Acidobacteriota bacterium]
MTEAQEHLILVVDDDPRVRELVTRLLAERGLGYATAADGDEALSVVTKHPPDVVLLDLVMPNKEGIETLRELRQLRPAMPVIAMSGTGSDNLAMASALGATATLSKPFRKEQLLAVVESALTLETEDEPY